MLLLSKLARFMRLCITACDIDTLILNLSRFLPGALMYSASWWLLSRASVHCFGSAISFDHTLMDDLTLGDFTMGMKAIRDLIKDIQVIKITCFPLGLSKPGSRKPGSRDPGRLFKTEISVLIWLKTGIFRF
jgi:hypothetical protein